MVGVVLIAFMAVLSTAYISASLNTQKAQAYHSTVVTEIEASDYNAEVLEKCKKKALENGYENLDIQVVTSAAGSKYAKVTLAYRYTIPLLNMLLEHQITGYAKIEKRGKESMPGTDETCSDGYFFILIMLIFAGASIYTAETKTMHQNELDSILGAAMEESMEILTVNPTYSIGKEVEGKELAADFIQNMLMRTTSKSTFEVEILTADAQKGLLDVRVTEYYRQIWGTGKAVARKTVILDDVEGKEEVFSKISFWKSYKDNKGEEKRIVKQVVVPEGILLPKEILPVENESGDEKVKGWRAVGQSENTIYTKENIGTVQAKGDMDFEAVYEKTGSKAD